jgi:predicted neutral ceramidase superfamily lipid hydrolase
VGAHASHEKLLPILKKAVERALKDLQPVSVAVDKRKVSLEVMGARKQSELVSTVNALVSIIKILAPTIFILSLILVAASLVFLR